MHAALVSSVLTRIYRPKGTNNVMTTPSSSDSQYQTLVCMCTTVNKAS